MKNIRIPREIDIAKIGSPNLGYITVWEGHDEISFTVKRIYWTYYTPNHVVRGHHAHEKLEQVIVAVSGIINLVFEDSKGNEYEFTLDEPSKGVYVPPGYWRTIRFSHNAVLLCMASEAYDESDYIRNYEDFKRKG